MLKTPTKSPYLALGDKLADARWNFIAQGSNNCQWPLSQRRYFTSDCSGRATEELEQGLLCPPSLPVFIAENAAAAVDNHNRISGQQVSPLIVYADGSRIRKRLGAAAIMPALGKYSQAYLDTDPGLRVRTAELMGIWMAIDMALETKAPEVVVFSDCQMALRAIRKQKHGRGCYITDTFRKAMHEVHRVGLGVQLHWVPAHKGIAGNESAHWLAHEAAKSGL